MIRTIADLLNSFMNEESKKLDEYELNHGPTIGNMYEGLSKKILDKTIPESLGLRVVDGFIKNSLGNESGQIDCMLVKGEGEPIPYTESYKYDIKNVVAVFEVKKNLFSKDLVDSFEHTKMVSELFSQELFEGPDNGLINITPALKVFSKMTGIFAPEYDQRETLSPELQVIYHTLITEQLTPIRIVLGYGGYRKEKNLRKGLVDFYQDKRIGYGIPAFPHLITCNGISLVKLNGHPYFDSLQNGYWDFYGSSLSNPLIFLLELIWTKLSNEYNIRIPWGNDLEVETVKIFLSALPVVIGHPCYGNGGWKLKHTELSDDDLSNVPKSDIWEPIEISYVEFLIFERLCAKGTLSIEDLFLNEIIAQNGINKKDLIKQLIATHYVALKDDFLRLLGSHYECVKLPNDKYVIADNTDGKLTIYLQQFM
nr:DUF6602 domain-containing protein [uncultured Desulfobacter sp.]